MRKALAALLLGSAALAGPTQAQAQDAGGEAARSARSEQLQRWRERAQARSEVRRERMERRAAPDMRGNGGPDLGVRPDRSGWDGQRGVRAQEARGWDGRRRTEPRRIEDRRAEGGLGGFVGERMRADRPGDGADPRGGFGAGAPRDRVEPGRLDAFRQRAREQEARREAERRERAFADHRRWDNRWHGDRRYDWRGHRDRYGYIFRAPRYYDPFGYAYGYRRYSIGFRLGRDYYGQRYWIDDPYGYRLPAAYGPYRWVRYYDDALLIDIYNGRVVDVVYDFFW